MKKEKGKKKKGRRRRRGNQFFCKKNPTKELLVSRIPLWELSLQKKVEGC
jgi:hypothetical protein